MKVALRRSAGLDAPAGEAAEAREAGGALLERLESICAGRGLAGLADRLADLAALVGEDMADFEQAFAELPRHPHLVGRASGHLIDLGGKRLRPMCVALASRVGAGYSPVVRELALAVELVHAATLLHDDVVDWSDTRRGAPTARAIYGNAASIFAGDWVLVEALRRVRRSRLPGLLDDLLDTIEEMIFAESLQLESRGRISTDRETYFRIVEGKTASVFRWAMGAGATAGGLSRRERRALETYGLHLGVAFQATDDLLDLTGDATATGKELFTDLREGKMTFPVIVALERDPTLRPVVEAIVAQPAEEPVSEEAAAIVVGALRATRAVEDCLALARERTERAIASLSELRANRAVAALATVALSITDRNL